MGSSHVLDDGSAIGVSMRLPQIIASGMRKSVPKQLDDGIVPSGIHDGFMRENRIAIQMSRAEEQSAEAKRSRNKTIRPRHEMDRLHVGCLPDSDQQHRCQSVTL